MIRGIMPEDNTKVYLFRIPFDSAFSVETDIRAVLPFVGKIKMLDRIIFSDDKYVGIMIRKGG